METNKEITFEMYLKIQREELTKQLLLIRQSYSESDNHYDLNTLLDFCDNNFNKLNHIINIVKTGISRYYVKDILNYLLNSYGFKYKWIESDDYRLQRKRPLVLSIQNSNDEKRFVLLPFSDNIEALKMIEKEFEEYTAVYWADKSDKWKRKIKRLNELQDELNIKEDDKCSFNYISIESFFNNYFSSEEYTLYEKMILNSVPEIKEIIGINVVSSLTSTELSNLKGRIKKKIENADFSDQLYISKNKNKTIKNLDSISYGDREHLYNNFIKSGNYKLLIVGEDFAKSYVTSEYLYEVMGKGEGFDYTSIVAGYLKTVEQLLYRLMLLALEKSSDSIFINKSTVYRKTIIDGEITARNGKIQIPFVKSNLPFFDTSIGALIHSLCSHDEFWEVSRSTLYCIKSVLLAFGQECRNDHFHKDNIYDWETVTNIKNNTLVVCYLLLGAFKQELLSTISEKDIIAKNERYDSFMREMWSMPGMFNTLIQFNGKEPIKIQKLLSKEPFHYDEMGLIDICPIKCVQIDDFYKGERFTKEHDDYYERVANNPPIVFTRDSIPDYVWWVFDNDERFVVWDINKT